MERSTSRGIIIGSWFLAAAFAIGLFVNCGGSSSSPTAKTLNDSESRLYEPGPNDIRNPLALTINGREVLDSPDPNVYQHDGKYYLTFTPSFGNIPIFVSDDLKTWTFLKYAFADTDATMVGNALKVGSHYYCNIWAPELHDDDFGGVQLSFTAVRLAALPEGFCPPYVENSGIYVASSPEGIDGSFAVQARTPEEPKPLAMPASCGQRDSAAPHSPAESFASCGDIPCDAILRLDQTVFKDQGKTWLGYSWYTHSSPVNDWERANNGEHLSVTELDPHDDYAIPCADHHELIPLVNPHDANLNESLRSACSFCDQFLSFTTDRQGRPFYAPNGYLQGVAEGASFFRRGDWVYLLASGGVWDSPTYHVFWIGAHSVEELSQNNSRRVVGRFLVPDGRYSYGHGSVVSRPDGHFFYIYHRLDHAACLELGDCRRRLMISPIEFEDRGDGQGDMHITARLPAETDPVVHLQNDRHGLVSR